MSNVESFINAFRQPSEAQQKAFWKRFRKAANEYAGINGRKFTEMERELKELRKDKARLDWLESKGGNVYLCRAGYSIPNEHTREAIDEAIKDSE